jgi:hypothetical protein
VHRGGYELLTPTDDPDVVLVRAHQHVKFLVVAIVAPIGAAVAAAFGRWELAGFGLVLSFLALILRARRTVIDRRTRRYGERFSWSRGSDLPYALSDGPVTVARRERVSKGTVEVTYDVAVGRQVMASGLLWGDAEKLSGELSRFLGEPSPS